METHLRQIALAQVVDAIPGEPDLSAVGGVEPADGVEQGGLAATRRGGEADEAALLDLEIDVVETGDLDLTLAVGLAQIDAAY